MLKITIPSIELFDETNQEFITTKEQTLQLEHSLVSLSKWESKWCKPFLSQDTRTIEEYIFDKKDVSEMNDQLFLIYVDSITTEMGDILMTDNSEIPDDLLGVDSNE